MIPSYPVERLIGRSHLGDGPQPCLARPSSVGQKRERRDILRPIFKTRGPSCMQARYHLQMESSPLSLIFSDNELYCSKYKVLTLQRRASFQVPCAGITDELVQQSCHSQNICRNSQSTTHRPCILNRVEAETDDEFILQRAKPPRNHRSIPQSQASLQDGFSAVS